MKLLILGGGAQGSAAAFDLARRSEVESLVVADLDVACPAPFLGRFPAGRVSYRTLDATDQSDVLDAMRGMDGVLCALPYYMNLRMARLALQSGCNYCDLGGNTELVQQQKSLDEAAREKGVSLVPDCGLAPGMVNILAEAGIDALDQTDSVKMRVGGLPQDPEPPLNYQIVYSLHGVIDYLTNPALALRDYEPTWQEPLSGIEAVRFPEPVGELEAFFTAGGVSTQPFRHRGRIREMDYKTLRYPGHAHIMRAIRDLGLLDVEPVRVQDCQVSPRLAFIEIVSPRLRKPDSPDLVAVSVDVRGSLDGQPTRIRYELVDSYDRENRMTAMMRTTGFSLAATAVMQADGRIAAGAHTPDECVPAIEYIDEMRSRGVEIERVQSAA